MGLHVFSFVCLVYLVKNTELWFDNHRISANVEVESQLLVDVPGDRHRAVRRPRLAAPRTPMEEMMMTDYDTDFDLYDLWKIANVDLPSVENVFLESLEKVHDYTSIGTEKYGPVGHELAATASILEQAMYSTHMALMRGALGVGKAVNDFATVDGSNSDELTKAGEQLEADIDDEDAAPVGISVLPESPNHVPMAGE